MWKKFLVKLRFVKNRTNHTYEIRSTRHVQVSRIRRRSLTFFNSSHTWHRKRCETHADKMRENLLSLETLQFILRFKNDNNPCFSFSPLTHSPFKSKALHVLRNKGSAERNTFEVLCFILVKQSMYLHVQPISIQQQASTISSVNVMNARGLNNTHPILHALTRTNFSFYIFLMRKFIQFYI